MQEALKLLHGMPVAAGSALVFNGVANQFYSTRLPFRDDCLSHETYPEPVELPLGRTNTVQELFAAARASLQGPLRLVLERELVVAVECPRCSWRGEVMRPRVRVKASDAICPAMQGRRPPRICERGRGRFARRAAEPLSRVRYSPLRYCEGRRGGRVGLLPPGRRPSGSLRHRVGIRPLSGDEITFGEMSVRELERRQQPDRDRRFVVFGLCQCLAVADLPIFLDRRAADAIERHALSDTSVELGGILLGKECLDQQTGQPFVWISHSLEAKHYANTQASFTYTHDSWERDHTPKGDQKFPDFDIVGWYPHPTQLRDLLVAPSTCSFTSISSRATSPGGRMWSTRSTRRAVSFSGVTVRDEAQVAGYHLAADRGDRVALARLVNDLEQLPDSEASSGGTFSPRLEAELINMLSRPATHRDTVTPVEKAQLAAVFGLAGVFLGMLIVALAFWLYQLHGRIQEQTESITALSRLVQQSADSQRLVGDMLQARRLAGDKPAGLDVLYDKASRARDEAVRQLGIQRAINETLARPRTRTWLKTRVDKLAAE